jgi:hypothetical protein
MEAMDWTGMAMYREWWQALENMVMNLLVP